LSLEGGEKKKKKKRPWELEISKPLTHKEVGAGRW
jgi:hypothetical protein